MRKIKYTRFKDIDTFFSDSCEVDTLEEGAKKYGGATKLKDGIFSNFEESDELIINDDYNSISIFIPSTIHVDEPINNSKYVGKYLKKLYKKYYYADNDIFHAKGSWYNEKKDEIVYEDITIITFHFYKPLSDKIIKNFIKMALTVKEEMDQDCVSLVINENLCLI